MVKCESLTRISLFSLLTSLFLSLGFAAPGLDTLRLRPNERIVIIAPHPDDEVLACGGLIQQALALGDSVWVVYVTCGDGSWPSAWRVTGNLFPGPKDYLELGRARIEEAKAGAKILGLDTTHLIFLGFPDGELDRLVFEHHFDEVPVQSSHTRTSGNPYGSARSIYTGGAIVNDLYQQIARHRADRIFLPHPLDAHTDHWATAAVLPAVRELWRRFEGQEAGYQVEMTGSGLRNSPFPLSSFPPVYYYIVHRPPYPSAYLSPADELSPPGDLTGTSHHWFTLPTTSQETDRTLAALRCHWSQFIDLGPDLAGYVARNELFDVIDPDSGTARGDARAVGLLPSLRIDSLTASVTSGKAAVFRLFLPGAPASGFDYRLYVWSFGPQQMARVIHLGGDYLDTLASISEPLQMVADNGWTVYLPNIWLGHEDMVFFTASVLWQGKLLNHSGVGWVVPSRP
jgi:LmbE family N-acetylglucosaminyl deacetylase